jgi:uncharacterized membrane protein
MRVITPNVTSAVMPRQVLYRSHLSFFIDTESKG